MNLDIFKQTDPSGTLKKEKYVSTKYPDEYNYIIDWCNKYNLHDLKFSLKVYHVINDLKEIPKCYCGKNVKFKNSTDGYNKYCSKKCVNNSKDVVHKRKQTNIKRYGTDKPQQLDIIKQKTIKTNNERYGVDYGILNSEIKQKSIDTLQNNYGVDNPNKCKEILDKRVNTYKKNIKSIKDKYKQTCIDKYGVDHPWKVKQIHDKSIEKTTKKIHEKYTKQIIERLSNINHELINIDWIFKTITAKCNKGHEYEISTYLFNLRYLNNNNTCTVCNPIDSASGLEIELQQFIKDNYDGEILLNDRSVLNGKELDVYLPELGIAFEFNGVYWHSELHKPKKYHLEKTNNCKDKGIQLIHIWQDDWICKQNIVKSVILNKLNKSNKIYARKCVIKELTNKEVKVFLNENHLQGSINAKYNLGLFYNNELVSLMNFGKTRINLGYNKNNDSLELYRFCNKLNTTVIGGASKLFKYFINNYEYSEIITYADYSRSNGNMYEKLGFTYIKNTDVNYWWVINKIRSNRYNWNKQKLIKLGYDKNKSENDIMHELGYYRLYDCGSIKYVFNK